MTGTVRVKQSIMKLSLHFLRLITALFHIDYSSLIRIHAVIKPSIVQIVSPEAKGSNDIFKTLTSFASKLTSCNNRKVRLKFLTLIHVDSEGSSLPFILTVSSRCGEYAPATNITGHLQNNTKVHSSHTTEIYNVWWNHPFRIWELEMKWVDLWQLLKLKTLMVGHGGSSAGSYLGDPTSPMPSHCLCNAKLNYIDTIFL